MMFSKLFVSFKEGIVFWNSSRRLLFRIFIIILYNFAFHLLNNRMQMSMVIEFTIVIRNTWYECRNIKWWRFPSFSFLSKKELFFEIFLDDYYFVFSIILYNFASHLLDNWVKFKTKWLLWLLWVISLDCKCPWLRLSSWYQANRVYYCNSKYVVRM